MEKINELLNNLENIGNHIPKLDTLTGWIQWLVSLAVRVGPICILVLGLIYLLIPPKEANRKAGYRTYFGMGSVMAWRFTQRIAGILMIPVGLILSIAAYVTAAKFTQMDMMTMAYAAFGAIRVQVVCALILFAAMFVVTAVFFDRNGTCRFPDMVDSSVGKWLFKEESGKKLVKKQAPAEVPAQTEFEVQGEQVITADDIVIEGLE